MSFFALMEARAAFRSLTGRMNAKDSALAKMLPVIPKRREVAYAAVHRGLEVAIGRWEDRLMGIAHTYAELESRAEKINEELKLIVMWPG